MTLEEFHAVIEQIGIPAVYGAYQENQAAPYIAYQSINRNVIHADGIVVYSEEWVELRLVTKYRDLESERIIENLLTGNGIAFDYPDFDFDDTQMVHIVTYTFMLQVATHSDPEPVEVYEGTDGNVYLGTDGAVYASMLA